MVEVIRTTGNQAGGYQDSRVSGAKAEDGKQRSEDRIRKIGGASRHPIFSKYNGVKRGFYPLGLSSTG